MRKSVDTINHSPGTAEQVFEAIHAIMHLYRSRQYRDLRGTPFELSHMENKVLAFFARHPGATQSDLVQQSGRDKAQLTRLIRGLRDKGLLEARVDDKDRRSTLLQLTSEGKRIHRNLQAQGARLNALAVEGLTEEECRRLLGMLARVRGNLEDEAVAGDE